MNDTPTVDRAKETALQVVSTKYPADRVHLLEAVQKRRGDLYVSQTVRAALDELIERYFPGSTRQGSEDEGDPVWEASRRDAEKARRSSDR